MAVLGRALINELLIGLPLGSHAHAMKSQCYVADAHFRLIRPSRDSGDRQLSGKLNQHFDTEPTPELFC